MLFNAARLPLAMRPISQGLVEREAFPALDSEGEIEKVDEEEEGDSADAIPLTTPAIEDAVMREEIPWARSHSIGTFAEPARPVSQQHEMTKGLAIDVSIPQERQLGDESAPLLSPLTVAEVTHMSTAGMTDVPLSPVTIDYDHRSAMQLEEALATPRPTMARHLRKPSSLEIPQNDLTFAQTRAELPEEEGEGSLEFGTAETGSIRSSSTASVSVIRTASMSKSLSSSVRTIERRDSTSSNSSAEAVNWQQLDRTEEQEKTGVAEAGEDESTAFLLARLEQENTLLTSDPKSAVSRSTAANRQSQSQSRPPGIGHLKRLVSHRDGPSVRYSLAPDMLPEEPPPMTELEFWAALVQDYPQTAVRLPTLTSNKIRAGIPPPLRGVVWVSMSGARDKSLEESYDRLLTKKSPYEGIINKDIGRSFPGVEMFMDAEGEGQKMLSRVLNCFSLHDKDIGYCQGLGFLVGPLLMQMEERQAFCVLVRLMEHFSLRPSFLPSLHGLHMRIYQFSTLLAQHQPELQAHLTGMGVEPAYLSQWFLSCFAVTCPLPMLFRIYDVIFAEGANETVMRVALALMRRNEQRMLEAREFEDVMQMLLGRAVWDPYACNADDLVDDFTSLGGIVTHERLAELEREFEAKTAAGESASVGQAAGFLPVVQAAASGFLGRLWAPSHNASKSTATLSPQSAEQGGLLARPGNFLRRSPSKQSLATMANESSDSNSSSGSASMASTAPTELDRTDSVDVASLKESTYGQVTKEDRDLHGQIEDLLMALSEMQREHASMATMLQQEREERSEDHRVVRGLVGRLQNETTGAAATSKEERRRTMPPPARTKRAGGRPISEAAGEEQLDGLVERVEERLSTNKRISASFETKAHLRDTIARTREALTREAARSTELSTRADMAEKSFIFEHARSEELAARLNSAEKDCVAEQYRTEELSGRLEAAEKGILAFGTEAGDLRDQIKDARAKLAEEQQARQRAEYSLRDLQAQARASERNHSLYEVPTLSRLNTSPRGRPRTDSVGSAGSGLRELRLGRTDSTTSIQSPRSKREMRHNRTSASAAVISGSSPETSPVFAVRPSTSEGSIPPPAPAAESAKAPVSFAKLQPPAESGVVFAKRTSSLATKDVLATPQHEPVPEEALLLELVNAKTAEAQLRQEVDEVKRHMYLQARQQAARFEEVKAHAAREVELVRISAAAAKLDMPVTPARTANGVGQDGRFGTGNSSPATTPDAFATPKTVGGSGSGSSGGGGWFWGKRSASNGGVPPTS